MISYGNSLVECGNDGFDLDGDGSYTILETFIFAAGDNGLELESVPNGILNIERSTVVKSDDYGMEFENNAWNVEVISSLFAENGEAAFLFTDDDYDENNMLTLIDTCYDGIDRNGNNALKIITSVDTNYGGVLARAQVESLLTLLILLTLLLTLLLVLRA